MFKDIIHDTQFLHTTTVRTIMKIGLNLILVSFMSTNIRPIFPTFKTDVLMINLLKILSYVYMFNLLFTELTVEW